jgi:ring-1,2-phenylacetyl-CoA epoxidase subunit PaaE
MLAFNSLTVTDVRPETAGAVRIAFAIPPELANAYAFQAGQHVNLRTRLNGEELRRSYSICTAPDSGELAVCIRRVPGGRFSNWANDEVRPGTTLDVMTPAGRFFTPLDPSHHKYYLAFAAGIGITPIIAMAKAALAREPHSRFMLCYGNRTVDSIVFREEIEDLKNRYMARFVRHHVLSAEPQDIDLYNGRIDGAKARSLYQWFTAGVEVDACYVCGPASMIDQVVAALAGAGLARERIHFERFGAARAPVTTGAGIPESTATRVQSHSASVTVIMNGRRRQFFAGRDGPGLVDAAAAQGIDLPFSCKSGVCSTCRTRLVDGEVRMETNYALERWELEAGYILACQSRPCTDRLTLDYDQN